MLNVVVSLPRAVELRLAEIMRPRMSFSVSMLELDPEAAALA